MWLKVYESGCRFYFLGSFSMTFLFETGGFSTNYFEEFYWEAICPTHSKAESYPYVCLDEQYFSPLLMQYFTYILELADCHKSFVLMNWHASGLQQLIHNSFHIILVAALLFMHKAEHILWRPTFLRTFMKILIIGLVQIPQLLWDLMHQNKRYVYIGRSLTVVVLVRSVHLKDILKKILGAIL